MTVLCPEFVRQLPEKLGMTTEQVATLLGIRHSDLLRYMEKGVANIPLATLMELLLAGTIDAPTIHGVRGGGHLDKDGKASYRLYPSLYPD